MPSKQVESACSYGASLWPNAISVWPSFHPFVFSPFHLFHSSCSLSFSFRFLRIFIAMILRSAFTTNWCMCPVTTNTRMVLNMVAIAMGRSSFWMTSRQSMMATPGGTKKKPRFASRNWDSFSTHSSLTILVLRKNVSSNIPMMLDGSLMPVAQTTTSPSARHPKITKNCLAI